MVLFSSSLNKAIALCFPATAATCCGVWPALFFTDRHLTPACTRLSIFVKSSSITARNSSFVRTSDLGILGGSVDATATSVDCWPRPLRAQNASFLNCRSRASSSAFLRLSSLANHLSSNRSLRTEQHKGEGWRGNALFMSVCLTV
jgi:hypothetical protein|eukprot:COSAG05_NODE_589_length_8502_cov_4.469713_4_plen_146_part_00